VDRRYCESTRNVVFDSKSDVKQFEKWVAAVKAGAKELESSLSEQKSSKKDGLTGDCLLVMQISMLLALLFSSFVSSPLSLSLCSFSQVILVVNVLLLLPPNLLLLPLFVLTSRNSLSLLALPKR
jgi:hypothetical protein